MDIINLKNVRPEVRLEKMAKLIYWLGIIIIGFSIFEMIGGKVNEIGITFIIIGFGLYLILVGFFFRVISTMQCTLSSIDLTLKKQPCPKADELTKLKKLLDDGVLSKEEFEVEKKKILNAN